MALSFQWLEERTHHPIIHCVLCFLMQLLKFMKEFFEQQLSKDGGFIANRVEWGLSFAGQMITCKKIFGKQGQTKLEDDAPNIVYWALRTA